MARQHGLRPGSKEERERTAGRCSGACQQERAFVSSVGSADNSYLVAPRSFEDVLQ